MRNLANTVKMYTVAKYYCSVNEKLNIYAVGRFWYDSERYIGWCFVSLYVIVKISNFQNQASHDTYNGKAVPASYITSESPGSYLKKYVRQTDI